MIKFQKLVLEDDPLFGSAVLDFTDGLTVVYGLNKASPHSRNGNAAGKSYLYSLIPEILWGTPVVGIKGDRQVLGNRELHLQIGKNRYVFVAQGRSLKVLENGKLKFKSVTETRKWVRTLPLSEQDFEGLYYLDSRRAHPLVMGTSSERNAYLTRFFGLDKLDARRKIIASALTATKVEVAKAQELRNALQVLEQHRPEGRPRDIKARIEELDEKLERLLKIQRRYQQRRRAEDFAVSMARPLKACSTFLDLDDDQQLTDKAWALTLKKVEQELEEDKESREHARAWAAHRQRTEEYVEALAALPLEVRKIPVAKYSDYKRDYLQYQKLKATLVDAQDEPQKPRRVKAVDPKALKALQRQVDKLEHELEHAETFGSGNCPTCGQTVKSRPLKTVRKELTTLTSELEDAERQDQDHRRYVQALERYTEEHRLWERNEQQRLKIRKQLRLLKNKARLWPKLRDLPPPVPPFEGRKLQLEVTENMVALAQAKIEALKALQPGLPLLRLLRSTKAVKDPGPKIQELTTELARARALLENHRTYVRHKRRLEKDLHSILGKLEDVEALQVLSQAYSDKGVKRLAIEAASSLLANQLNKYAPMIFSEDYRFTVQWDRSQLSILCHRRYGRRRVVTDVRKLSGAESRLFTYLLVFCQLQFVPAQRRSSLMILDEPTTNMHEETTEAFNSLLKILQTIVPQIVVITPHPTEHYEQARRLTVVKVRGRSKIIENHPNSL